MNEDARISREGVIATFQHILEGTQKLNDYYTQALMNSRDLTGQPHRELVEELSSHLEARLDEEEAFIAAKGQGQ